MILDGTVIRHGGNDRGGWDGLAVFSPEPAPVFRYYLERTFRQRPLDERPGLMLFALLNPSDADENRPDPTTSRCATIAKLANVRRWGVVNMLAVRSPKPVVARRALEAARRSAAAGDPPNAVDVYARGLANVAAHRQALTEVAETDGLVVCAWGAPPWAAPFAREFTRLALDIAGPERIRIVYLTDDGAGPPGHPLYTARELWTLTTWPGAAEYAAAA